MRELLAKALRRGNHTIEAILSEVSAGRMQLWPGQKTIVITELRPMGARTVCHVLYVAGCGREAAKIEDAIALWAKGQGCASMTGTGRQGWQRVLSKRGWRTIEITMERAI